MNIGLAIILGIVLGAAVVFVMVELFKSGDGE